MKTYAVVAFAALVFAANHAQATPVFEVNTTMHEQHAFHDLVPAASINFDTIPAIEGELSIDTSGAGLLTKKSALLTNWTPSWLSRAPKRWWHSLHGWNDWVDNTSTSAVPEPATMLLFGTGLAGVAMVTRKRMKK